MPDLDGLRDDLLSWYRRHARDLPWRRTCDPYAIWVSEVMLQQTRVDTVAPRFERWMARFPTVKALARAPLDDVLEEWAGLGYYARARNLHSAAREVAERYGGRVPDDAPSVRALPGVGRYTAGAILSIAYRKPEPVLDGNVIRVLTRLQRIEGDPRGAAVQRVLWEIAGRLVAEGDPADTNQALMELGAVVCHPREPACLLCPVARRCAARREGDVERFPSPTRATRVVAIDQVAVALVRRGRVLLARRPPRGLWGGLLELPTGAPRPGETLAEAARRVARERVGLLVTRTAPLAHFRHVLSHRRITFHGFRGDAPRGRVRLDGYDGHRWVDLRSAVGLGISRATARLLAALTEDAA